jgi:hypothetical protein
MKNWLNRGLMAFVVLFVILAAAAAFYVRPGRGPRETVDDDALDIVKAVAIQNANLHGFLANATDNVVYYAHAVGQQDASKQNYVRFDLNQLMPQAK